MYWNLVQFFENLFYDYPDTDTFMELRVCFNSYDKANDTWSTSFMDLGEYLARLCALISLIIIVVLCCLFIAKLVKGVAHLINR